MAPEMDMQNRLDLWEKRGEYQIDHKLDVMPGVSLCLQVPFGGLKGKLRETTNFGGLSGIETPVSVSCAVDKGPT